MENVILKGDSEYMVVLLADLRQIVNNARTNVAYAANQELTLMHWRMGERINREVLGNERAAYGKQIVAQVARQLSWSHFVEVLELYLRWLEKNEMEPGEESPLGLLLCTEGSEEQIELLQLDKSGIKVAQYMTELPPRDVLIQQIRKSMEIAKGLGKS